VKMKRGDGKPNFPEQRLKAGGETKGTRPPLDEDPLFHLWLLQGLHNMFFNIQSDRYYYVWIARFLNDHLVRGIRPSGDLHASAERLDENIE